VRRATKIILAALAVVVAVLILNALAVSRQTKEAETTVDGAEIVETSVGGLQVLEEGNPQGSPIVLIHCYACSLQWWDQLAPLLSGDHRVIRVDLLGHGGSDKPRVGYAIEEQAGGVAEALAETGVERATVVGHSLGATVAAALASQSPELASRVVNIDQAPSGDYGELSFSARLGYQPVIGEALNRVAQFAPASLVEDQYQQAFAPDFSISTGFDNPDQVVDDLRAMTYTAYTDAAEAEDDYTDEEPLDQRFADVGVPLLVIFGAEDQIYDAEEAIAPYGEVPGARTALIEGAGHSPNVEAPDQVARLIREFAVPPRAASPFGSGPPRASSEHGGRAGKAGA
jgi:pimeloyl-ACP methyl ester carboxylesterase